MRFVKYFFAALCFIAACCRLQAQSYTELSRPLHLIPQIELYSQQEKKLSIQLAAKPLTLLVFLSPECPLCRNYTLVLNKLQQAFAEQVQLVGVVPGTAYEKDAVSKFSADYGLQFPLLEDPQKKLAGYVAATITPEVVLVNKTGVIVYRGAIDDWVEELGKKKIKAEKNYLEDAINQYIAGEAVAVKKTTPKGCYINEF